MSLPEGVYIIQSTFVTKGLHWGDYAVFGIVLLVSLSISMISGFKKTNDKNEFSNQNGTQPVALVSFSLVGSFVSAVTLLGNPSEVYFYGQQYTMIALAFIPMTALLSYIYVPVYFDLQLKSVYEYFEWRFNRKVRLMCSILAMTHLVFYTPITVLGPSLAIDQVAGFDFRISAATIFLVCIINSSISGGLSAILWSNTLQTVVMFVALFALAICGVIEVGGFSLAWERSQATDRTLLFNMDLDPRVRHTFWTATVGGAFVWLTIFGATQGQIQRYNYVATLAQSRQCLLWNMVGMILVMLLCSFMGLLIYSKYYDCDPVHAKIVTSADQLLPLFVMDVLRNFQFLPGLLIAGITCGSLSTVTSAVNAFAVLLTEDFIKHYRPKWDDGQLYQSAKVTSACAGLLGLGLVFIIRILNDTIQISPFSTLIHGSLLGPILGAFSLGLFLPWANTSGTVLGMTTSIIVSGFIGMGSIIASSLNVLPDMRLPLTLRGCPCSNSTDDFIVTCSDFLPPENHTQLDIDDHTHWKDTNHSLLLRFWSTSYIWQPGIGAVSTFIFGIIFSFIVIIVKSKDNEKKKVHVKLLSKPVMRLWSCILGESKLDEWIEYGDKGKFGKHLANNFPTEKDFKRTDILVVNGTKRNLVAKLGVEFACTPLQSQQCISALNLIQLWDYIDPDNTNQMINLIIIKGSGTLGVAGERTAFRPSVLTLEVTVTHRFIGWSTFEEYVLCGWIDYSNRRETSVDVNIKNHRDIAFIILHFIKSDYSKLIIA